MYVIATQLAILFHLKADHLYRYDKVVRKERVEIP